MSDIHSTEEAMEQIANALNYLEDHFASPEVKFIQTNSARIAFDEDAGRWFVEARVRKIRESS